VSTMQPLRRGAARRLLDIDRRLDLMYGAPEALLGNHDDPLDEAIFIVLSFQTDIPRAKSTWHALRAAYPTWEELEQASPRELASVLRMGGLHHQKARTITQLLREVRKLAGELSLSFLGEKGDGEAEHILTRLPGLSWKAARCVLLYSLRREAFPVDGNTFRILRRSGVIAKDAIYRRRGLHDALQAAVPVDRRRQLHVNLVVHGQRTCRPRSPLCSECQLLPICPRVGVSPLRGSVGHDRLKSMS
jgi:endonuclease III